MMSALGSSAPGHVGDDQVVAVADYEARVRTDVRSRRTSALSLPESNVLAYELASGSRIIARPSGTEPKAKFYFDVLESVREKESVSPARVRAASNLYRQKDAFQTLLHL